MDLNIEKITVGEWDENVYLVYSEQDLVIIDPGDEADNLISRIEELKIKPQAILLTHGHFDHIGAICPLVKHFDIPFYMHSKDKRLLRQANFYRKMSRSQTFIEVPRPDQFLDEETVLTFGDLSLSVMHVPGHTNGSVCFRYGNHLISGDLIFEMEEGRTDLPESDPELLKHSIRGLMKEFPEGIIYPGHGEVFRVAKIEQMLNDKN